MMMADCDDEEEGIPIQPFPPEVLERIFGYLDGKTLAKSFSVCRRWNSILESMATGSSLWFDRCKAEIPKYTVLQMCDHPREAHYRTGPEWRDVYVRWYTHRGSRFWDGAQLKLKRMLTRSTLEALLTHQYGEGVGQYCFTDDLVFVRQDDNLVVYDMHSDASLRKAISSNIPNNVIAMAVLGMRIPVETGGKTAFQIAVEGTVLVIVRRMLLEVFVGLELQSTQRMFPEEAYLYYPISSWYNTVLIPFKMWGSKFKFGLYRVEMTGEGQKKCSVSQDSQSWHDKSDFLTSLTLIGDRALTLNERCLTLWDVEHAEKLFVISHPNSDFPIDRGKKRPVSWVGRTIAAPLYNSTRSPRIVLYHLDKDCTTLQHITWIRCRNYPDSMRLLYDNSLWVINIRQCELLVENPKNAGEDQDLAVGNGTQEQGGTVTEGANELQVGAKTHWQCELLAEKHNEVGAAGDGQNVEVVNRGPNDKGLVIELHKELQDVTKTLRHCDLLVEEPNRADATGECQNLFVGNRNQEQGGTIAGEANKLNDVAKTHRQCELLAEKPNTVGASGDGQNGEAVNRSPKDTGLAPRAAVEIQNVAKTRLDGECQNQLLLNWIKKNGGYIPGGTQEQVQDARAMLDGECSQQDGQSFGDGADGQRMSDPSNGRTFGEPKADQSIDKNSDLQCNGNNVKCCGDSKDVQSIDCSKGYQGFGVGSGDRKENLVLQETGDDSEAKSEMGLYKKNLSLLLGISEDSPLWSNYDCDLNEDENDDERDKKREGNASDDDDEEDDSDSSGEPSDDGSECDDDWIQYSRKPFAFVTLEQSGRRCNHYLSSNNYSRIRSKSLISSFPHLGCSKIDWRFMFSGISVGFESLCHSPCKNRFILYEWNVSG